jgi:biopolymer transport protein ExbB
LDTELFSLVKTGGVAMWLIGFCSVAAVAVGVERLLALWRFGDQARSLADAVTRALFRGDLEDGRAQCERSRSPAAEVFLAALVSGGPAARAGGAAPSQEKLAAAVERQRQQVNLKLRQHLWMLGTIGATAPFIGLFGTVVGIMRAFHQMAATGQGGFSVVAAGISEALVTTAGGIAVAVEAVVIYNFLNTHVQKLALQLKLLTEEYLEIVKEVLPARAAAPAVADQRQGA